MHRYMYWLALSLVLANAAGALAATPPASAAPKTDRLAAEFRTPPDSAKPWAYWWWLNGNVSKPGITKDLEEMKRQGINGVLVFHAGGGKTPQGPQFLSPEWHELFRYALREAGRLGMEVSVSLCDGWDSGGPWITPDQANKKLVYSELQVDGRRRLSRLLPMPPVLDGYYRDVTAVAIRETPGRPVPPAGVTASSNLEGYVGEWNFVPQDTVDGDPETYWSSAAVSPAPGRPAWLEFEYHDPLPATAVYVAPADGSGPRECLLESSADGKAFAPVCRFQMEKGVAKRVEFAEVAAKHFRLSMLSSYAAPIHVAEVILLRKGDKPRLRRGVKWWWFKSGNRSFWDYPRQGPAALAEEYEDDGAFDCRSGEVVDLSRQVDATGRIDWEVPEGRWTVLRFGYTLEGQRIRAESIGGRGGYEADMLSSAGIESHFRNTAEPMLADAAAVGAKVLKYFHIDSYELGADVRGQQPTWSPAFREEFKARRGYELLPYLPALARRIVDSREETNRFLADFRWTIGDLIAERFWGRFAELAHARGAGVHTETGYGTYPWPHIDALLCAGKNDVTMGEFWYGTDIMSQFNHWGNVIRSVASAAHVYGRPIVQAEAFTAWTHWLEYPYVLKPVGDEAFTSGLNRMVFHQYTHQPKLDMKPGWQYFAGTHFDRNITWWEQARAFFEYLARCQYLLQQGHFVADAAYFYGEGVTKFVPSKEYLRPPLPKGYDFDAINADVLLNRLSVRNGRLVLPDGMSYRVLVLPADGKMSARVRRRIEELSRAGATVAASFSPAFAPDFTYPGDASLEYIHRTTPEAEIYFVANRKEREESVACTFRVTGRQPELWDPVTGDTWAAQAFTQAGGRTTVPLQFAPYGSLFVVFRKPIAADRNGAAAENFPVYSRPHALGGPWTVRFDPKWGGPERVEFPSLTSWTTRPEEGIRHYSGTATYRKTFDLPPGLRTAARLALDLGDLRNVARVRLNGKDLGVLWTKPFRVEITGAVRPDGNILEVDVVNLWPNRLIGDAALPPEKRLGQTNITYKKDHPLLESGLLGPVTLQIVGSR